VGGRHCCEQVTVFLPAKRGRAPFPPPPPSLRLSSVCRWEVGEEAERAEGGKEGLALSEGVKEGLAL
jgi:hypothetical protein